MKKNIFFVHFGAFMAKKLFFSKKLNFSKKLLFLIFLFMQSQVYGYPRNPLKKWANFAVLKFSFFAKNAPKCAKKYFCVSGHLGNLKTYLDTKFQLIWPSNSRENQNNTLLKN